jgi:hypothetical protein
MTWRARCAWSSPSRRAGGGARLTVRRALESPELRQRLVIRENNIKDE